MDPITTGWVTQGDASANYAQGFIGTSSTRQIVGVHFAKGLDEVVTQENIASLQRDG